MRLVNRKVPATCIAGVVTGVFVAQLVRVELIEDLKCCAWPTGEGNAGDLQRS